MAKKGNCPCTVTTPHILFECGLKRCTTIKVVVGNHLHARNDCWSEDEILNQHGHAHPGLNFKLALKKLVIYKALLKKLKTK